MGTGTACLDSAATRRSRPRQDRLPAQTGEATARGALPLIHCVAARAEGLVLGLLALDVLQNRFDD